LQYNPDTLTRSFQVKGVGGESADRSEALRLKGPAVESIKLDAMLGYCEAARCRRAILLEYFGEVAPACGNCDVCLNPPETWDGTVAAQKMLSAAVRTGSRFGAAHLVDVLRGNATERVAQLGHHRLPRQGRSGWGAARGGAATRGVGSTACRPRTLRRASTHRSCACRAREVKLELRRASHTTAGEVRAGAGRRRRTWETERMTPCWKPCERCVVSCHNARTCQPMSFSTT
jgi:superfamily II DNA helicase RecQ